MELNELVKLIQDGHTELYLVLWYRVRGFVKTKAYSRLSRHHGFDDGGTVGGVDLDDLMQSGFLALLEAVKTYDENQGSFIGWLALYLRKSFREAMGIRTTRRDPIDSAFSLDRENYDGSTIGDNIESSVRFEETVEDRVYREQFRAAVEKALTEIPEREAAVFRQVFLEDKTLKESGAAIGVSPERARILRNDALRDIKRAKALRTFLSDSMNYYLRIGPSSFNRTHSSATEQLAFRRMDLEEKFFFGEI